MLERYRDRDDVAVLALPRGGVPVGYEVATALRAPLDVFVVRKLGVPGHEGSNRPPPAPAAVDPSARPLLRALEHADALGPRRPICAVIRVIRGSRSPHRPETRVIEHAADGESDGDSMSAASAAKREASVSGRAPPLLARRVPLGQADIAQTDGSLSELPPPSPAKRIDTAASPSHRRRVQPVVVAVSRHRRGPSERSTGEGRQQAAIPWDAVGRNPTALGTSAVSGVVRAGDMCRESSSAGPGSGSHRGGQAIEAPIAHRKVQVSVAEPSSWGEPLDRSWDDFALRGFEESPSDKSAVSSATAAGRRQRGRLRPVQSRRRSSATQALMGAP
jgi:hypothetical protein